MKRKTNNSNEPIQEIKRIILKGKDLSQEDAEKKKREGKRGQFDITHLIG
jgi:hypothetical protein